jgi:hypothetical protein
MRKALALIFFLILCCFTGRGVILYAQGDAPPYDESIPDDNDSEDDSEEGSLAGPELDIYIPDKYAKGDQIVTVSLGAAFPVLFLNSNGDLIDHKFTPPVGGVLSLAYTYFLGPYLFVGGEIGFITAFTLSQNAVFIIPIGIRAGWQFVFRRFEFPVYLAIGIAPQKYLDFGYFGMYLKGAAAGFFRYNPNWSFGLSVDWNWLPQWPMENEARVPNKDINGNFLNVSLSARYHF